ncbi:hypothetical protein XELAEV_180354392mg, partial [Xenopus laevis]
MTVRPLWDRRDSYWRRHSRLVALCF